MVADEEEKMNSTHLPFKKRENPMDNTTAPQTKSVASSRDKYTATMDSELRKRVKIAAVKKGIVFSQFIEEAVLDKLDKEGF